MKRRRENISKNILPLPEGSSAADSRCWLNTCRGRVSSSTTFARTKCFLNSFLFISWLSCPRSVQTSLTQNCHMLTLLGFPDNLFPVSCGNIGFKKSPRSSIGLEIRPQSICTAFKALLPFLIWSVPSKFKFKKVDQTAVSICSGLRTYYIAVFFSRAENPSEDITSCLFLMNMKGLRLYLYV